MQWRSSLSGKVRPRAVIPAGRRSERISFHLPEVGESIGTFVARSQNSKGMEELVRWSNHSDKERGATILGGEISGATCDACGRAAFSLNYHDLVISPDHAEIVRARLWRWPLVFSDLRHLAVHEKVATWIVQRGYSGFGLHPARLVSPEVRRAICLDDIYRMATPENLRIVREAGIHLEGISARSQCLADQRPSLKFAPAYFVVEPLGRCEAQTPEGLFDVCPACDRRTKKVPGSLKTPFEAPRDRWDGSDLSRETAHYPWLKYLRREVAEEMQERWKGWISFSAGVYGIRVLDPA